MNEPKPISESELRGLLKQEYEAADTFTNGSTVTGQRAQGMAYYLGSKIGNEVKGRSQVVSRDTFETIEWIIPQIMKLFLGPDAAVKFAPEGPEDVELAEQTTEFVNYSIMRKNKGFLRLHDWFKDALIQKKGYLKVFWDDRMTNEVQHYKGLDQSEFMMLQQLPGVKVLEAKQVGQTKDSVSGKPSPLIDAKVRYTKQYGCLSLKNIAPENFKVRPGLVDLCDTSGSFYCAEAFNATKTDLLQAGYPKEIVDKCKFNDENHRLSAGDLLKMARSANDGSQVSIGFQVGTPHESMKNGVFVNSYIRIDMDGDGFAELLEIVHDEDVSNILSIEEIDDHPFVDLDIIRVPHKHIGLSIADVMKDITEIKTVLLRGMLDHSYYTINGRWAVLDGAVNMTDLTNPVPGGAVRETVPNAVRRLDTPTLDPSTFGLLDYVDRIRERRAGVNELQQGVDKEAMGSNVMTGAMDKMMKAAQERILMMANTIAETGVKDLFYKAYSVMRKNNPKEEIIQLRGKFISMRPMDWKDRADMTVQVGVGNTSPTEKLQELTLIRDTMTQAMNVGAGIVVPSSWYHLGTEMIKATGRRDYDKFFSNPDDPAAPKPPSPGPSIDQQIEQAKVDVDKGKLQLERDKFEWQKVVDTAETILEDQQQRAVGIGKPRVPTPRG